MDSGFAKQALGVVCWLGIAAASGEAGRWALSSKIKKLREMATYLQMDDQNEEIAPSLQLQPGDRVCIKMDVYGSDCGRDQIVLDATKGSIGVVISYEEYREYEEEPYKRSNFAKPPNFEDRLLGHKKAIERDFIYPIKFEYVAPPTITCDILSCGVGRIHLIHPFFYTRGKYELVLEKMD